MKLLFTTALWCACIFALMGQSQNQWQTRFERSNGTQSAPYQEGIDYLQQLDKAYGDLKLFTYGTTDAGLPLHLAVAATDKAFSLEKARAQNKIIVLINNAIHPGEPDGVDASLMFLRDLMQSPEKKKLLDKVVLLVIPYYNIDGALNRNSSSRANQNGPAQYGFRGNGKNLDLNRDYIKCDSENAKTFTRIFRSWDPDIFVDAHVSNGADYQHVMTLLTTQEDKFGGVLGNYLRNNMTPALYQSMAAKQLPLCPYVNVWEDTPEQGFIQFLEPPRFSSGYAVLFHTIAFVTETHMLKPYDQRVKATYAFFESLLNFAGKDADQIRQLRLQTAKTVAEQQQFPLTWAVDTTRQSSIDFWGYKAEYDTSAVTGLPQLRYRHDKPYRANIKFYNYYKPGVTVQKPLAYVIPQAYKDVIERLQLNGVAMRRLKADTTVNLQVYYIENYRTVPQPYESHYLHSQTQVRKENQSVALRKGDYIITVNQAVNRYIVETLEPQATDSFFNWNFFDGILQQKEGFSDYVFEPVAARLLAENETLKKEFEAKKAADKDFAANPYAQLDYLYKRSPHYEKSHRRYPVYRIEQALDLP